MRNVLSVEIFSLRASAFFAAIFLACTTAAVAQETGRAEAEPKSRISKEVLEDYTTIQAQGWTLRLNRKLKESKPIKVEKMLALLNPQLQRVADVVPQGALKHLRTVPIWINPPYEGVQPTAEYHPSAQWLRQNGRRPAMAQAIEITTVDRFEFENTRMPYLMLHELSHAYHDQVLGFNQRKIRKAFDAAEASGSYDEVDRFTGRKVIKDKAYAMTNHKEYFAESSEAFFGKNDFFPFDRAELEEHDPEMVEVVKEAWGVLKP